MLQIKHLSKSFQTSESLHKVIDDLSLEIEDGEFVTIIGSNGSGKTTLLNLICGTYIPDEGQILINGKDITHLKEHKRAKFLGRVFQDPKMGTVSNMEIEENLALAYRRGKHHGLRNRISAKERELFKEQLKQLDLGLENRIHSSIGLLSGGQRQAITLLMACLNNPQLLLLDEHTAALDPKTAAKVMSFTDKVVSEKKITTFMITHNMKDAIKYGNRLIMLNKGKIVLDVKGKDKENLTIETLLAKFNRIDKEMVVPDSSILG